MEGKPLNAWMLGLISISVSMPLQAGVTEFGAGLDQSVWRLDLGHTGGVPAGHPHSPLGTGAFVSRAGRKINLDFELKGSGPRRVPDGEPQDHAAQLASRGLRQADKPAAVHQQFDGLVAGRTAWTMLDELEGGRMPTFQYRDWYRQDRPVKVSLSSVNFRVKYQAFMDCLRSGLLPYSLSDIAFSVLL